MHDEQSFEEMYRATDALWSGRPNSQLVAEDTRAAVAAARELVAVS